MLLKIQCTTHFVSLISTGTFSIQYYVLLNLSKKIPFNKPLISSSTSFKNQIRSDLYISLLHCSVDYEDIRGQRVSHHAAEAEYVGEMSRCQRLADQASRGGRTQHLSGV